MSQRMIDLGDETHKGCLDLSLVKSLRVSRDSNGTRVLDLVTDTRMWHFSECTEAGKEGAKNTDLDFWINTFKQFCQALQPPPCEETAIVEVKEKDDDKYRGYSL